MADSFDNVGKIIKERESEAKALKKCLAEATDNEKTKMKRKVVFLTWKMLKLEKNPWTLVITAECDEAKFSSMDLYIK